MMNCPVCGPLPRREYGNSSGRAFDDMKRAPILEARKTTALLIRAEIARIRLDIRQGKPVRASIYEGPPIGLATPGYHIDGELKALEAIALALEIMPPEPPEEP